MLHSLAICGQCVARYRDLARCPYCGSSEPSQLYYFDRPDKGNGLGDTNTNVAIGAAGAKIAVGAAANAGWISAAAVPVIGTVIAGVGLALTAIFNRKGPQQKIQTTQIVNALEPELKKNLEGYLNGARTEADQAAALQNFDDAWAGLVAVCSQAKYGEPGQRCIHDRERGSSKGYDWFKLYRDPIANDTPKPNVYLSDPVTSAAGAITAPLTDVFGSRWPLVAAAGLALLAILSDGGRG